MDPKQSLTVCQLVAGMIARDNILERAERQFLNRVIARMGLSVHDVDDILPILEPAEAVARFQALPEEARAATLEMLLEAAMADGKVVEPEREMLVAVAAVMGVDREQIDAAIARRLAHRG